MSALGMQRNGNGGVRSVSTPEVKPDDKSSGLSALGLLTGVGVAQTGSAIGHMLGAKHLPKLKAVQALAGLTPVPHVSRLANWLGSKLHVMKRVDPTDAAAVAGMSSRYTGGFLGGTAGKITALPAAAAASAYVDDKTAADNQAIYDAAFQELKAKALQQAQLYGMSGLAAGATAAGG